LTSAHVKEVERLPCKEKQGAFEVSEREEVVRCKRCKSSALWRRATGQREALPTVLLRSLAPWTTPPTTTTTIMSSLTRMPSAAKSTTTPISPRTVRPRPRRRAVFGSRHGGDVWRDPQDRGAAAFFGSLDGPGQRGDIASRGVGPSGRKHRQVPLPRVARVCENCRQARPVGSPPRLRRRLARWPRNVPVLGRSPPRVNPSQGR
jgi:hypothetical protein